MLISSRSNVRARELSIKGRLVRNSLPSLASIFGVIDFQCLLCSDATAQTVSVPNSLAVIRAISGGDSPSRILVTASEELAMDSTLYPP